MLESTKYMKEKFKLKRNIVYFTFMILFGVAGFLFVCFAIPHFVVFLRQPSFLFEGNKLTRSMGFLITFQIFLGIAILLWIPAVVFGILFFRDDDTKKAKKGNKMKNINKEIKAEKQE